MAEGVIKSEMTLIDNRFGISPSTQTRPVVLNGTGNGNTGLMLDYISSNNSIRVYVGGVLKGTISLS